MPSQMVRFCKIMEHHKFVCHSCTWALLIFFISSNFNICAAKASTRLAFYTNTHIAVEIINEYFNLCLNLSKNINNSTCLKVLFFFPPLFTHLVALEKSSLYKPPSLSCFSSWHLPPSMFWLLFLMASELISFDLNITASDTYRY